MILYCFARQIKLIITLQAKFGLRTRVWHWSTLTPVFSFRFNPMITTVLSIYLCLCLTRPALCSASVYHRVSHDPSRFPGSALLERQPAGVRSPVSVRPPQPLWALPLQVSPAASLIHSWVMLGYDESLTVNAGHRHSSLVLLLLPCNFPLSSYLNPSSPQDSKGCDKIGQWWDKAVILGLFTVIFIKLRQVKSFKLLN